MFINQEKHSQFESVKNQIQKNDFKDNLTLHGKVRIISFLNPSSYWNIINSPLEVDNIKFYVDGSSLIQVMKLLFNQSLSRFSFDFTSVAGNVFSFCIKNQLRVALVGGKLDDVNRYCAHIKLLFPKLNIVYSHHGYFTEDNLKHVVNEMIEAKPHIVIAGLGAVKQEQFLLECKDGIDSMEIGITCGGFLTQTAQRPHFYPSFVTRFGGRWLYRAIVAKHVRRKLILEYIPFFILCCYIQLNTSLKNAAARFKGRH